MNKSFKKFNIYVTAVTRSQDPASIPPPDKNHILSDEELKMFNSAASVHSRITPVLQYIVTNLIKDSRTITAIKGDDRAYIRFKSATMIVFRKAYNSHSYKLNEPVLTCSPEQGLFIHEEKLIAGNSFETTDPDRIRLATNTEIDEFFEKLNPVDAILLAQKLSEEFIPTVL